MNRKSTAAASTVEQSDELAQWSSVDNWPLPDVLNKLADATECLLNDYNYDRDGWEQLKYAALAARRHVALLTAAPASPAALREEAERATCANCAESIIREGDGEWDHECEWKPECLNPVPATTPPSTLAKAAAEEIQKQFSNYVPHVFIDKFAAIIERCFSGGGERSE